MSCFAASWFKLMSTCSSNLTQAQRASWHQSAQFPSAMCKPSMKPLLNPLFASDYRAGVSNSAWIRVPTSPPSCLCSPGCAVSLLQHHQAHNHLPWRGLGQGFNAFTNCSAFGEIWTHVVESFRKSSRQENCNLNAKIRAN